MTDMKSISAMSFKRACALNATSNESVLIHFVSGKFCSYESLMSDWNFILDKMTDMKSIPFWVSFHLNSCEHKQRPDWTPKWDFQPKWNLIPVWVHFARTLIRCFNKHINAITLFRWRAEGTRELQDLCKRGLCLAPVPYL